MTRNLKITGALLAVLLGFLVTAPAQQRLTDATMEMARNRFKQGLTLFNDYSYLGAVEYFRSALSVYPQYHLAREYLARSYRLAGYTDEALTEWELLYDISDDISVKNKIDMLRYMRAGIGGVAGTIPEYVEVSRIRSADVSYYHFPFPADITVDNEKNLYITSFNTGKIVKMSHDGKGISTMRPEQDSRLYGIDCNADHVLFSDFANDRVHIADKKLRTELTIGSPGSGEGEFHGVQGVAFDAEGDIYAVDSGNHRVQKFSRDGVYLLQFGRRGQYEGEFTNPTDVAVDGDSVFVTDTGSGRILVFDASGNYMREIKNDMLTAPRGITVSGGLLYVSDSDTGLAIIDPATGDGRLIDSWRDGEETFSRLYASVIDRDGYLYLLDHNLQSVIAFSEIEQTYTNIDIEIRSVDTASYPTIAFYLSVRNRGGTPLYALSAENFTVFEDNARMQRLSIDYLKERPKRSTAVFCVDRSASMKQWHDELQWSADFYFKNMTVEDRVRIVNAGVRDWVGNDFDWSRRRAQQALRQQRYEGDTPALGRVLYNAVSELVDTESSRAVVLFTDGNQTDAAFAQYPPGVIADYARAHYIPVYIISLDADNDTLRMIARSSGGAFIRAREAEQLQDLYTDIRSQEEYRYVLVYESFKTSGFTGWWSDVTVDVESQGRRGREWGGYFVP